MKVKIGISVLIVCIFWGCKLDTESAVDKEVTSVIKPPEKYYTQFDKKECKLQIDSAKIDANNGRLVYVDTKHGWSIIRYDDEMREILQKYGIEYVKSGPNCTLDQECYGYYMDSIISNRFEKGFIKQVEQKADSLFLSRWKTKTYESWEIDEHPVYKEVDADLFIEDKIRFPENWDTVSIKFEREYLMIDVYISNTGEMVKWEFNKLYNLKESNKQYLSDIRREIEQVLKQMNDWIPAELNGKKVNSRIWLDIDLDKE